MQAEAKQCLHVFPEGSSATQRAHKNKKTEKGTLGAEKAAAEAAAFCQASVAV